jgi:predicted TIM-barrel fold metal-dependent hydrolase
MQTMVSLLVEGAPEKFPNLDFVFLEAGISWLPYMMYRLNKEYSIRKDEAPLLRKQPEEYIRESFYFASQPLGEPMNPAHMQALIDIIGADSLLFASDYPHWDFDHPSELNAHLIDRFDEEQRAKILHENATSVFNLST